MLALVRSLDVSLDALADPNYGDAHWLGLPVFQSDMEVVESGEFNSAILAIDKPSDRARAYALYKQAGFKFPDLIASQPGEGTTYGDGLVLQMLANLSVDCRLGNCIRINVAANVMHDAELGDFVTIAPNAVLLGRVRVGSGSYIGANATILPDIVIGKNCMVGAGAVVTRNVADGETVAGVPARCMM